MDASVVVAVIGSGASIFGAALTFYLTKRHQLNVEWQHEKLNHYKTLLAAISELAIGDTDMDAARLKFATTVNTIALVASQRVVEALMAFHDEIKFSNKKRSSDRHDELLNKLLLAIRKDVGLSGHDDPESFKFHLIASKPKPQSES